MKGIEFWIEKTTSEIETVLINPRVESTLEVFELSFARFSLQALQIADTLITNSNLEKHIPILFQRLASKLKDSRSCKPEKPESDEEIHLQDDEITKFLNTRKDSRNSQNISELEWFLGEAEKKKKDTENFLEHVSKLSKKMEVSIEPVVKENNDVQTEIIWISDLKTIEGSSLDLKNIFCGAEKSCNCSEKKKEKDKCGENLEEGNEIEQNTSSIPERNGENEEINFQILEPSKKLQTVKQKKTRDSKRISIFTPKKNHQPRSSRSPQNLFADTQTNIPSILKEIKEREKIINSLNSSPSKPTPKVPAFKGKVERMVRLSENKEEDDSIEKCSMSESESNKEIEKEEMFENKMKRGKREEKWFDKIKAKTSEIPEKKESTNGGLVSEKKESTNESLVSEKEEEENKTKGVDKMENCKLELILESEEVVEVDNIKSNLFENETSKFTSNFTKPVSTSLNENLSEILGENKSAEKVYFVDEGSKNILNKDESLKEKKERRANYLKELLTLKKEKKEPFKQSSLSQKENVNKVTNDKSDKNEKKMSKMSKMSKMYTVHRESEIEESPVRGEPDDKQIEKPEYKLNFEGFEEKFKAQTIQRIDDKMKSTANKDDFKTLPSIYRNKLELNKFLPKEENKIQLNLTAKMKNEKSEIFHESFKENYDGHTELIEEIDHESLSIAEMMKKDKVIIGKISELQKNGKQNEGQIRFYVDVLERTHLRFCGKNCKHLERFYKHLKISNSWSNRVPITLATRKIGFFS